MSASSGKELPLTFDAATLSYETFRRECLLPNLPAVIRGAVRAFSVRDVHTNTVCPPEENLGVMKSWFTRRGLERLFGDLSAKECPVYQSNPQTGDISSDDHCNDDSVIVPLRLPLTSIFERWQHAQLSNAPFYAKERLYLMNWHFQQEAEQEALQRGDGLYKIPDFLGPDMMHPFFLHVRENAKHSRPLNGFGDGTSDYRFVYWGVEQTWTPLHYDVFGSFSWSLNVSGKKRWFFFTEESQHRFEQSQRPGLRGPPDMRCVSDAEVLSFVQDEGDMVFVPSAWYHQVHNMASDNNNEDESGEGPSAARAVLSINHNWISGEQVLRMTRILFKEVSTLMSVFVDKSTRNAFDDTEWMELVEKMLLTSGSWNLGIMSSFLNDCLSNLSAALERSSSPSAITESDCAGCVPECDSSIRGAVKQEWEAMIRESLLLIERMRCIILARE